MMPYEETVYNQAGLGVLCIICRPRVPLGKSYIFTQLLR